VPFRNSLSLLLLVRILNPCFLVFKFLCSTITGIVSVASSGKIIIQTLLNNWIFQILPIDKPCKSEVVKCVFSSWTQFSEKYSRHKSYFLEWYTGEHKFESNIKCFMEWKWTLQRHLDNNTDPPPNDCPLILYYLCLSNII